MAQNATGNTGKRAKTGCFTGCFMVLLVAWLLFVATTISPEASPWTLYRTGGYDNTPAVVALIGSIFIYCLKLVAEGFWNWLTKVDEEDNG